MKLISFLVPSYRIHFLERMFNEFEKTTTHPENIEFLIKIDTGLPGGIEFLEEQKQIRPFEIRYIVTPKLEGQPTLWLAVEQLFFLSDPTSYFIQIMSDEPYFVTQGWDEKIKNYVHLIPDDVFRLRLSTMKLANYTSHYECTFRPDSFAIYTRRWLEITEGTGNCWGSDAYQQCITFHLSMGPGSYSNIYRVGAQWRDIPVFDIEMAGLEFGEDVPPDEKKRRHKRNLKEWDRLTSHQMQEHFSYLARRMGCYIWAFEQGLTNFKLTNDKIRKMVVLHDTAGKILYLEPYHVSLFLVCLQNLYRLGYTKPIYISKKLLKLPAWSMLQLISGLFSPVVELWNKSFGSHIKSNGPLTPPNTPIKEELSDITTMTKYTMSFPRCGARRQHKILYLVKSFLIVFYPISKIIKNFFALRPPGLESIYSPKESSLSNKDVSWLKTHLVKLKKQKMDLRNKIYYFPPKS